MQKEVTSKLELAIAKIELKRMEVIDKLSISHNDYVIRCVTSPETKKFIAVNGDWEKVTGYDENHCVGMDWCDFIPNENVDDVIMESIDPLYDTDEFDSFVSDIITKEGESIRVNWKAKHYPEINAVVSIGRVKK